MQVKLLRVLQEGEIRRVGEAKAIKIDVRIVAATARDLIKEVNEGRFREDLFYRLNVFPVQIPPLRERREDIPLLVSHFINKYNGVIGKKVTGIQPRALETLMNYRWFGNIRELENTIERTIVLADGPEIEKENLPSEIQEFQERVPSPPVPEEEYSIKKASKSMEISLIQKALNKTKGNHTHAARILEISHRALLYKIKEYGLEEKGV